MFCICFKGTVYDSYFIGFDTNENGRKGAIFSTDEKDRRIKKYKTRAGCEKTFNEVLKNSSDPWKDSIRIVEINK